MPQQCLIKLKQHQYVTKFLRLSREVNTMRGGNSLVACLASGRGD